MYDFDKQNIFFYIVFGFVLIICLKIYNESDAFNLKCIISDVDGEKYCVRERSKLQLAADLLARVTGNCKDLVAFVGQKYPDNEDINRQENPLIQAQDAVVIDNSDIIREQQLAFVLKLIEDLKLISE